jgi:xanthine dehydrogenase molybdenum-binding subunit
VVNVIEVQVDPDTGQVIPLKITAAHDVGFIMNPQLLQAQIDGATVQGLGFALMEEVVVGDDGRPQVANLGDYKIPTSADVPEFISVFVEGEPGPGPFGAKAVGELSLTVIAPALAGAVQQAVGVRVMENPVTSERVYAALKSRREQP